MFEFMDMTNKALPNTLKDCANAHIAQLLDDRVFTLIK